MATVMPDTAHGQMTLSSQVEAIGPELARYGLVVIVGWIGLMKFTAYEAEGIRLYVTNSPLMSWVYAWMSVRASRPCLASSRLASQSSSLLARSRSRIRPRQRLGRRDVSHDLEFPLHHTGCLGTEPRRLPRPLGKAGAVPHQGPGPARDFALVVRRSLTRERAKRIRPDMRSSGPVCPIASPLPRGSDDKNSDDSRDVTRCRLHKRPSLGCPATKFLRG